MPNWSLHAKGILEGGSLPAPTSPITNSNDDDNLHLLSALCKQALFKMLYVFHLEYSLLQGLANFILKGQTVNFFFAFATYSLCHNHSILPLVL